MTDHVEQNILPSVLASSPEGLTGAEAAGRLRQFGPNAVSAMRPRGAGALLRKFWGVVPWMLEAAMVLDLVLGRWVEAIVIAALLVFNALIGFMQEGRAQNALALLRQRLTVTARVRRDGRWQQLPSFQLVPGDLVRLRAGDVVPADVRLSDGLVQVDQSQLTGESLPVEQTAQSTVYAGSSVSRGEATGSVVATGARTYFGKTAELVRLAESPRRLELLIVKIAKWLAAMVVVLAIAVFAATVWRGTPLLDMLPFGLLLLVASVPVALPMMFTMSAALGARALAESGILVTRLSAIQDAAAMDVLCLDKTGTITENRLSVAKVEGSAGVAPDEVLRLGALACDEATQDPIDLAILKAARDKGLMEGAPPRLGFVPFDPGSKRSEVSITQNDRVVRILKGAPSAIAELTRTPWPAIAADVARLSADGSRVLAVATGSGADLRIAGLIALGDPPRSDSAALIADLRKQGIRVLLVTGDGEATARAVAGRVGITGEVAPAGTLGEKLDPAAAVRFEIFPGVYPQDKFFLIRALQKAGHVVGMTGDGVNDAPALRQADVGIAVASATDVAKAAASLVLTRPGLGEIAMAIEGSRRIYQRILTFARTMISMKLAIPPFLALGLLVFGAYVVDPLMMILLFFSTDIVMMTVSMDRVSASPAPDKWAAGPLMVAGVGLAALFFLLNDAVFWTADKVLQLGTAEARTLVFVWLVFGVQAIIYVNRVRGHFWTIAPGRFVWLATLFDLTVVSLLATQGWLMAAIPASLLGAMLLLGAAFLVVADQLKVAAARLAARLPGARSGPAPAAA
jgi:H+-transporting ATPase